MSSNAVASIAYAPVPGFPAGSQLAGILVTLVGQAAGNTVPQEQTVAANATTVTFPISVSDTYTVTAVGVDAQGNTFGTPATSAPTPITVPTPAPVTVSLNLPSSVSVALGS